MTSAKRSSDGDRRDKDWSIVAYTDRLSVQPGGTLKVMVSTEHPAFTATVVRLGGDAPEEAEPALGGNYRGREQRAYAGSYVKVLPTRVLDDARSFTVRAWIYPTNPAAGRRQGIVSRMTSGGGGWALSLDEAGALLFDVGAGEIRTAHPLRARAWYEVTASYDSQTGEVRLALRALDRWLNDQLTADIRGTAAPGLSVDGRAPLLIGAGRWSDESRPHAEETFDGKIENPSLAATEVVAAWDFSVGISTARVTDTSPNGLHGTVVNMPMRAATSHNWDASEQSFVRAPEQYAAIHFHSDDLDDAGWEPDFEVAIPSDLRSGVYAIRLAAGSATDDVPFTVLPKPSARADIAFLLPTFTYLAYGDKNSRISDSTTDAYCCLRPTGSPAELETALELLDGDANGQFLARHPELGVSIYDYHADGSGCHFSSRLRPIIEMRPDHRHPRTDDPRHFSSDLLTLEWLERRGHRYDVLTDEDLHEGGVDAISSYRVLITGTHPEYISTEMLDAFDAYVDGGGHLMYLGGNGFYWVTSLDPVGHHTIEVRRGNAGTRAWSSEPGESYHSTTGEFGGLWRHRGRAPDQLVGVGFSAIGSVGASGYTRQPESARPEAEFVFRGVGDGEVIGDFGAIDGGAAGDEVDRMDFDLGTPPSTILLASAIGLPEAYKIAIEENNHTIRDQDARHNPRVRGDMVYIPRPGAGAVFSVGSINWSGSLGHNHDDNNVSRVTENVLRHFLGLD